MGILLLILGLVLFVGLVIVHEWGHFIMARRGGVEVEEFGIGFPPKAKTLTKKNGTEYTLNWLPLGGFVRLKGEHDNATGKGSYGAAPIKTKIKIMVAGVVMNLATAYIILVGLALVGIPKLVDNQFTIASNETPVKQQLFAGTIEADSPASRAGLQERDIIVSVSADGRTIATARADDFPQVTSAFAGKNVTITYERSGSQYMAVTQLRSHDEVAASKAAGQPKGYLGVSPGELSVSRYTWSAPVVAGGIIGQFTQLTMKGLGSAISGLVKTIGGIVTFNQQARSNGQKQAAEQVAGPVGVFVILQSGTDLGVLFILMIIAVISLTLAIMNVLPIPALDGGRLFVTLVFRALKKPLRADVEDRIHGTGFAILMVLFVLITIVDIKRFY